MSSTWLAVLLIALMGLSAVISASETAFFTLRPWRVERLRRERPGPGGVIADALRDPRVFLVSLIIGTELANVAASNVVAVLKRRFPWLGPQGEAGLVAGAAATSLVLVVLCDLGPKSLAVTFPDATALRLARPLRVFLRLVAPVARPLARLTAILTEPGRPRKAGRPAPATLSEEDFRTLVEISRVEGVLNAAQTEMIEAAFRLGDLQVRQVMVPRPDVVAIPEGATLDDALDLVRRSRHSRIPVFAGSVDAVTGVLYAKDLLARRFGLGAAAHSVRELARPALFVPEVMRAGQLVQELQRRRVHMAVVVDEYGGTAGVVTLEDLLEEMVGEFSDEFERPIRLFRRLRRGVFWVRASMGILDFNRRVRGRIKEPDVDTVGGYVLKRFDRVPSEGDSVSDGQFTFTVRRMKGQRILVLLVERRGSREASGSTPRARRAEATGAGEGPARDPRSRRRA